MHSESQQTRSEYQTPPPIVDQSLDIQAFFFACIVRHHQRVLHGCILRMELRNTYIDYGSE